MDKNLNEYPHRRYNPLTGEWVLVSPHRSKRPWQGQVEKHSVDTRPQYDPGCYLCPGNSRSGGEQNPQYKDVYVFTNDFSALLKDSPDFDIEEGDIFRAESEKGICRVICFSPDHSLTVPQMEVADIRKVVDLWIEEYQTLGSDPEINYVQIFENKGEIMGCSNPHPHGQIWASQKLPVEPFKKQRSQKEYFEKHNNSLLSDYLQKEINKNERLIFENDHFAAVVPFWATWPYEAMIIPKRAMARITDMSDEEKTGLADAYKRLTMIYDRVFDVSFPYSAGIHQAPTDDEQHNEWHWHMVFYPPLLRSATVKKFMVGYEMLATPQRDITPESAAQLLKDINQTI
ncbi:UDP-glucose--hexose-1-phosphate uridylyltransferase [Flavobacterium alkalisoli]|uniref:Galactose-1-phosphate uridylyltransferase n=1 Tax=Flavobacterium alkalisoli TaxID=2602769 RepID=A0A5B9FR11_9FLAO|nr:UDP-glucose--hexose-1-phosphate uridylyltransferase [Flavobacterium alkalisoli]QEE48158.1 UDP-glucose--hexose-1-phosphate uridylyltransferase [Flavobacterium alkalisoli]